MDSFEFNKIAGAVLGTLLATMAIGVLGEALFHAEAPEQPGWAVAVPEAGEGGAGPAEEEGPQLAVLLASADASAGEAIARRCVSCHSFEAGGANKVGPNLHDVVGAEITHVEGFGYSQAFEQLAGEGFEWTYEHLDGFLANPRGYISGTAMAFAGVRDAADRADLIAYLASQTENPPPLPEPEEEPAGDEAAAEDGAAQPTLEDGEATEQPTEPEPQEQAAEEEAEGAQATDQAEPSGEPQQASPDLGTDVQQTPEGEGAPVQPAPEDQESIAGARDETPVPAEGADEDAQPAAGQEQSAQGEQQEAPAEEAPAEEAPAGDQQGAAEPAQEEAAAEQEQAAAAGGDSALLAAVAAADVEEGQAQARKCTACHSLEEGGPNRVGPHIYGVVDRDIASLDDYNYSDALQGIEGDWTLENLDAFLANPREFARGTKMAFAGIRDEDDRHALLHYLYTLQENPQPLQ
ncbi:c-type cytochrome [Lutibaculum baratangense]|uniref:Membrane c-type cytochrome cy n=1 Tax=Lutibaculum baratangense AMV1 TaxID=631454 RepID=V4RQW9_9HYPH|nr:cytochrome c family protein [Lutibaculum baratangense]ESR25540.1 membrane c-type cytochrome cy [Lutibaculum baratangense AMV1]